MQRKCRQRYCTGGTAVYCVVRTRSSCKESLREKPVAGSDPRPPRVCGAGVYLNFSTSSGKRTSRPLVGRRTVRRLYSLRLQAAH